MMNWVKLDLVVINFVLTFNLSAFSVICIDQHECPGWQFLDYCKITNEEIIRLN